MLHGPNPSATTVNGSHLARSPHDWPAAVRILEVTSAGSASHSALIIAGPGLVLAPTLAQAEVEGIAVTASLPAPEILDALWRAHGLTCLPGAFRLDAGAKLRVTDTDLALLTATLYAIAAIDPVPGALASGEVSVSGRTVSVKVLVPP